MSRRDDIEQVATGVPFDNSSNGFTSTDVQGAIEELTNAVLTSASPGFSFGRSGNLPAGTWLSCETVPSNASGRYVYINSAYIKRVFVSNELTNTFDISVYYHYGNEAGLTLLGTVSIVSALGGAFSVNWAVPTGSQIAIQISTGSAKNAVAGLELSGTN